MQPFRKGANALARMALAGALAIAGGVPVLLGLWVRTPYVTGQYRTLTQPVPFDHRHHVVDDGIDCVYCHTDAERGPAAGVPPTDVCMNCHNQIWNRSPLLDAVWRSHENQRPIVWQRVHFLPDFVYFDHSVHVHKGIGCESCHGRVDEMARVYQAAPLTMGWCLECHREPERYVRPIDAVTVMGYRPSLPQAQIGRELVRTYAIRRVTHCTACHR
jgi:hypothetical protein